MTAASEPAAARGVLPTMVGYGKSVGIGSAFAVGWTPCIGPILGSILAIASLDQSGAAGADVGAWGSVLHGAFLLSAFTLRTLRFSARLAFGRVAISAISSSDMPDHNPSLHASNTSPGNNVLCRVMLMSGTGASPPMQHSTKFRIGWSSASSSVIAPS